MTHYKMTRYEIWNELQSADRETLFACVQQLWGSVVNCAANLSDDPIGDAEAGIRRALDGWRAGA